MSQLYPKTDPKQQQHYNICFRTLNKNWSLN